MAAWKTQAGRQAGIASVCRSIRPFSSRIHIPTSVSNPHWSVGAVVPVEVMQKPSPEGVAKFSEFAELLPASLSLSLALLSFSFSRHWGISENASGVTVLIRQSNPGYVGPSDFFPALLKFSIGFLSFFVSLYHSLVRESVMYARNWNPRVR